MKHTKELEQFKEGIQLIEKQIVQTLEKEGLQKIEIIFTITCCFFP